MLVLNLHVKGAYVLEARAVSRAPPFVTSRNDGNCRLTMPVGKGRCARDALPHAFHIAVFEIVLCELMDSRSINEPTFGGPSLLLVDRINMQ